MNPFENRGVYSFDVYPVAILGNNYKNVKVVSILDRESANQFVDTQALHLQIYPYLPAGTPNDPDAYDYVKLKMPNGNIVVLGMAWINLSTITTVDSRTITVKLLEVNSTDVPRIRDVLVANGFNRMEITVSS
jgi:hypothetical protein